ncbi:MAG: hypothetical protein ACSHXF_16340 [Aquaticitalea sp.]
MASIDQYQHRLLGFINCPSDYDFVHNNSTRQIAIYELGQDIPSDEKYFDGKTGDILIGGGSGEAPSLRLSIPICLKNILDDNWDGFNGYDKLYKSYWTPTKAFILCNGFIKIGWNPEREIESWLAENLCGFLIKHLKMYQDYDNDNSSFEKQLFITTDLKIGSTQHGV